MEAEVEDPLMHERSLRRFDRSVEYVRNIEEREESMEELRESQVRNVR